MGSVEVFEANIQFSEITPSTSLVISLFIFRSSKTASTIRSASESAVKSVVGKIFDNMLSFSFSEVFPNLMPLFKWLSAKFLPLSADSCVLSIRTTSIPAWAETKAIPAPIIPAPRTPSFLTD